MDKSGDHIPLVNAMVDEGFVVHTMPSGDVSVLNAGTLLSIPTAQKRLRSCDQHTVSHKYKPFTPLSRGVHVTPSGDVIT